MEQTGKHQYPELEYEQINENFRFVADVRLKLLALVPTLGGAAVFVLAHLGLEAGKAPASSSPELLIVLLVSLFGFFATLSITLYDQRNSELYHRAKHLEREFGVPRRRAGSGSDLCDLKGPGSDVSPQLLPVYQRVNKYIQSWNLHDG